MVEYIGVADTKRRFSEIADRVGRGESFIVVSRGEPVVALVPPQRIIDDDPGPPPLGLAAFAGALAGEWDSVDSDIAQIVGDRDRVPDRPPPDLG